MRISLLEMHPIDGLDERIATLELGWRKLLLHELIGDIAGRQRGEQVKDTDLPNDHSLICTPTVGTNVGQCGQAGTPCIVDWPKRRDTYYVEKQYGFTAQKIVRASI